MIEIQNYVKSKRKDSCAHACDITALTFNNVDTEGRDIAELTP